MKDYDSQRRSEVFGARGGKSQWLLLKEITNLKKITDICLILSYLAQEFIIYFFHLKYPFCSPRWPQQSPSLNAPDDAL